MPHMIHKIAKTIRMMRAKTAPAIAPPIRLILIVVVAACWPAGALPGDGLAVGGSTKFWRE